MYFLGHWTKQNALEAKYRQQKRHLDQAQASLQTQRNLLVQRQAALARQRASVQSETTVGEQQAVTRALVGAAPH
jgi:hypothetical protein